MNIYIVIGIFSFLLFYTLWAKKWFISTYIIALYILTLLVALLIENIFPFYTDSKEGSIVYVGALMLLFLPYLRKAPEIVCNQGQSSLDKTISISYTLSVILLLLDILIIPAIMVASATGFEDLRQEGFSAHYSGNFITNQAIHFIDILSPLSFTLLLVFFYLFSFVDCTKRTKVIIFLASLSAPYYGIISGGRTQMIYWLLSLGFNVVLFHKYIDSEKKKQLYKYMSLIVSSIAIYIMAATIARFASSDWGTENSLLIYIGQPYLNFGYFYENYQNIGNVTLDRIFPLSNSLINGNFDLEGYRDSIFSRTGLNIGIFYTLLGDLLVDVGVKGIFVYTTIYWIIATHFTRKTTIDLSSLLIINILFLIPLQGVFYYSFWKRQVTFCAILVILFSLYIKRNRYE